MKKIMGEGGRARALYNGLKSHKGVITTQSYLRLEKKNNHTEQRFF